MKVPRPPALFVLSAVALALVLGHALGGDPPVADESAVRESAVREPAVREPGIALPPARSALPGPLPQLSRRAAPAETAADLFAGHSWAPAPKPPAPLPQPAPPPPAAPPVPPLPFAYLGRIETGTGGPLVYLAHGPRVLEVSEGDLIEPGYRVESLGEDEIVFMYLPLAERQSLKTGS